MVNGKKDKGMQSHAFAQYEVTVSGIALGANQREPAETAK